MAGNAAALPIAIKNGVTAAQVTAAAASATAAAGSETNAAASATSAAAAVNGAGVTIAREAGLSSALASTSYTSVFYREGTQQNGTAFNFADFAQAHDAGTHLPVGQVIDAVSMRMQPAATATQVRCRVYERLTTDANINTAPPVAGDTLLDTVTLTLAAAGLTAATYGYGLFPLTSGIVVKTGKTYVIRVDAMDVSNAQVALGYAPRTEAAGTQRHAGWYHATPAAGTWTNVSTSSVLTLNLHRKVLQSSAPSADTISTTRFEDDDDRLGTVLNENQANLAAAGGKFPITLSGEFNSWGDSLVECTGVATGYKPTDIVANYVTGTVVNKGIGGQTSAQILTRIQAGTTAQKAGINIVKMGTNNSPFSVSGLMADYASAAAAFTSTNYVMQSPWLNTTNQGKLGSVRASLRSVYGAKFFDSALFWAKHHSGGASIRTWALPSGFTSDGLHHTSPAGLVEGNEHAMMTRALAGGAPYVHDDQAGFKLADASGTAILTPRILGTNIGVAVVAGNNDRAIAVDLATGAITRGTGTPTKSVYELYLRGRSNKGPGNAGRILLFQQMDGTSPQSAVRIKGNGASILYTPGFTGAAATQQLTIVLCARFNRTTLGTNRGTIIENCLTHDSNFPRLRCTPRDQTVTTMGDVYTPVPANPMDYNFFFMSFDAAAGLFKTAVNEEGTTSGAITNTSYPLDTVLYIFSNSGNSIPLVDLDIKMFWIAPTYIDVSNSANRALFYNTGTLLPKDLGSDGTASSTIAAPIVYLRGMAGDYMLGKNYGTGGDLYPPPFINAQQAGFVDIT